PVAPPEASTPAQPSAQAAAVPDRIAAPTQTSAPTLTETVARPIAAQLAEQLEARWPVLRASGPGTHVLTMRVEPEHFGPVRVVAHIGTEGVRIELLGATDAARDALRQALRDLRPDLAGVRPSADPHLVHRAAGRPDGGAPGAAD